MFYAVAARDNSTLKRRQRKNKTHTQASAHGLLKGYAMLSVEYIGHGVCQCVVSTEMDFEVLTWRRG